MLEGSKVNKKAISRQRIKYIVNSYNLNNAVKMLIEEEFCVSKAQAKRTWYQMRGKTD